MYEEIVYSHLIFTDFNVEFKDDNEPIPNWPIKFPESLQNLITPVTSGSHNYFSNLTTGQFLCILQTAKNFGAYGLEVKKENVSHSKWIDIATAWLSHFAEEKVECKAVWALFNRRFKRYKELQKCFNARQSITVKETLVAFLNSKLELPVSKKHVDHQETVRSSETDGYTTTNNNAVNLGYERPAININFDELLEKNKQLVKINSKQSTLMKSQNTVLNTLKVHNNVLKTDLSDKKKKFGAVGTDTLKKINELKKKSDDLSRRNQELKSLKIKSRIQEKQIQKMKGEIQCLSTAVTDTLDMVDETENKKMKMEEKLNSTRKLLKSTKKKVQRRNKNITGLQSKLHVSREKYETDKESIELYYKAIVEKLKNEHQLSMEMQQQKLKEMEILETQAGGKYKGEVRLLYYDLLTKGFLQIRYSQ